MSTVDPWFRTPTRHDRAPGAPGASAPRLLGTAVAGLACLALASLVASPGAAALTVPAQGPAAGAATLRAAAADELVDVIVRGAPGGADLLAAAVTGVGGTVGRSLDVVDGVQASVPSGAVARLRAADGVVAVTPDGVLTPLSSRWGDDTTGQGKRAGTGDGIWQARHDLGSAWSVARQVGAHEVWSTPAPDRSGRHLTGHGVDVAVIDTGVAPVEGLLGPGKLIHGPDLSFDSQAEGTRHTDGMGHGTHMAALVAGRDGAVRDGREDDPKHFVGIAPDAGVVSVKVGAGDGGVDVSQVVAAIDWVVSHQDAHDVRVINLSYGTASVQPYVLDPLAHAVQNAWHAGIVVVVAAGNDGEDGGDGAGPLPLTMPAADPFVIAVGSSDHRGSSDPAGTRVGAWTNAGTDARRPDLLAPGRSVVSLRVPGSLADVAHPEGLVPGDRGARLFRGTGTSQSAAVVSGAVALLLQADPDLTPDQVKGLLTASADPLPGDTDPVQGAGLLDVDGAVAMLTRGDVPAFAQDFPRSTGLGSIEASRAGTTVVDPLDGQVLQGEQDVFGTRWDAPAWAEASAAGRAWSGGTWNGQAWTGTGWADDRWAATEWTGRSWSGRSWSGRSWSTMTFLGRSWSGDDWAGRSWSGRSWSGRSWSGEEWAGRSWSGRSWSADGWSGRSWS